MRGDTVAKVLAVFLLMGIGLALGTPVAHAVYTLWLKVRS